MSIALTPDVTEISREEYEEEKRKRNRAYMAKHRAKHSQNDARLRWKYGITPEQREALFNAQGRVCAICKSTEPKGGGWNIDHCHKTKAVRGILCHPCNAGLGHFDDDPNALEAAAAYLRRTK